MFGPWVWWEPAAAHSALWRWKSGCAKRGLAPIPCSLPGLLAGLWEFPSLALGPGLKEKQQREALLAHVQAWAGEAVARGRLRHVGEVGHVFSHIHQTYVVYSLLLGGDPEAASGGRDEELERPAFRWVTQAEFQKSAVSTAMKKVLDPTPHPPIPGSGGRGSALCIPHGAPGSGGERAKLWDCWEGGGLSPAHTLPPIRVT
uniref:Adenine DNA glycosylase n=1 Tax=Chrysemys picta bellii TaxID=8478 RepID=A0A8C3FI43_CHRPI